MISVSILLVYLGLGLKVTSDGKVPKIAKELSFYSSEVNFIFESKPIRVQHQLPRVWDTLLGSHVCKARDLSTNN